MGGTPRGRHAAVGITLAAVMCLAAGALAPAKGQLPFDSTQWTLEAQTAVFERYEGRDALRLAGGTAWLDGVDLRDGTIHFDLRAPAELGFYGVAFRAVDRLNYEHVYLRPFLSGNPDASQYTPVFGGVTGWQVYAGPRFALPVAVATDRWVHVELRVRGGRAEAYVDGEPLVFPALQREPASGRIGLTAGGAPAWFANVVVTAEAPELAAGSGPAPDAVGPDVIRSWRVSGAFADSRVAGNADLDPSWTDDLAWQELEAGERGVANLARVSAFGPESNTVFAAVTLRTDAARRVTFRYGFSDRVTVYLNGRPLARGADVWRSRDYKFLGTIGLHDEVVLPLEPGDNELWLAVTEGFGGWGVVGELVGAEGVRSG